jgi:hypothetical protein
VALVPCELVKQRGLTDAATAVEDLKLSLPEAQPLSSQVDSWARARNVKRQRYLVGGFNRARMGR